MRKDGFSQEGLKGLACGAMVVDHVGAVFLPWMWLRVVGRISFPIFCFLIAEGMRHSRDPKRYLMRLGVGAVLSELPFDLLFYGGVCWERSSVMVTLLLGALVLAVRRWDQGRGLEMAALVAAVLAAELLGSDYGGLGVLVVVLFSLELPPVVRAGVLAVIFWLMGGGTLGPVPVQVFALAALVPIGAYSGQKRSYCRWVQWGFYLFYPVHLLVLLALEAFI